MEAISKIQPVDFSRESRKEALKSAHALITSMGDEDLERVAKLLKAEVKARGALATLQAEIDE